MSKLPSQNANPNGLHARYYLEKIDKEGGRSPIDEGSEYFILRLDEGGKDREHIKAGRIGIHAYADAIEHHIPQLAADLRSRYPILDAVPTFGTKAVGLSFNHAQGATKDAVHKAKQSFANVLDSIGDPSQDTEKRSWMYNVLRTAAINACIAAQMAVVKLLTWKD